MTIARSARATLGALLLAATAACGPAASTATDGGADQVGGPTGPCAGKIAECLDVQKACVVEGGVASCVVCKAGEYPGRAGGCLPLPGSPLAHDFAEFTVKPGQEISGHCQSWTIGNATELWVNAVELEQDVVSHHSNWTFVPADKFDGPDGVWRCRDRGYNQVEGALAGGVLYAQSTQATREVQKFPDGAAVRIPPYSRLIGDVHLLNASQSAVTGHVRMTLHAVPRADVKVKLAPFHMTYNALDIPPRARSRFTSFCDFGGEFYAKTPGANTMKLYYALPHTHALGRRFYLEVVGGPLAGRTLVDLMGFNGEPRGRYFDPPVDLSGTQGLRFGCEFDNPRDDRIGYGIGDQEMCEMLGFADSPLVFEANVSSNKADGADGAVQKFTGPCTILSFVWDFDKPGGPPP